MTLKRGDVSKMKNGDAAFVELVSGQVVSAEKQGNVWGLVPALATMANAVGIALHEAGEGQQVQIVYKGDVVFDEPQFNPGWAYYVSAKDAGALVPFTELAPGDYAVFVGIASDAQTLRVNLDNPVVKLKHAAKVAYVAPPQKASATVEAKEEPATDDTPAKPTIKKAGAPAVSAKKK